MWRISSSARSGTQRSCTRVSDVLEMPGACGCLDLDVGPVRELWLGREPGDARGGGFLVRKDRFRCRGSRTSTLLPPTRSEQLRELRIRT